jgi:hypothetical protein
MTETTTTARFCFDRSWSGGNPPDRLGIEAILEDMVEGPLGTGRIEGEGDDTVVVIEGNFNDDHLGRVSNELADYGMRRECCK